MARSKGFIVSAEVTHKAHMTRIKKQEDGGTKDPIYVKQILYITGKEKDGFDFWESIRKILRPMSQYTLCKKITREIVNEKWWQDIEKIKEMLSKYFDIVIGKKPKVKKIKRTMNLTDEERERRSALGKSRKGKKRIKSIEGVNE